MAKKAQRKLPTKSDPLLRWLYWKFRRLFFAGEWMPWRVVVAWANISDGDLGESCHWTVKKGHRLEDYCAILISRGLKPHRIFVEQTVLHEMIHVKLSVSGKCPVSCKAKIDHGRFEAEVRRIFELGAYDGLL